uniref:Uncharacterized protein n=1 Tax=Setaria viridis TaxID=4556 RepID=A0A4U6U7S7_SETVI|nr:hypothetical protein SEVIR_6G215900v2 [Setaria viridis]
MRCLAWRLFGRRRAVCGSPPGHGGGDSGEWRGRDMPARGRGLHDIYPRTQPPCVVMRAARSQCLSFPGPPRHQLPGRPHSRLARCMHARPGSHGRDRWGRRGPWPWHAVTAPVPCLRVARVLVAARHGHQSGRRLNSSRPVATTLSRSRATDQRRRVGQCSRLGTTRVPIRPGAPNKTMDHASHDDVACGRAARRARTRRGGHHEGGYVTCLLLEAKVVCNQSERPSARQDPPVTAGKATPRASAWPHRGSSSGRADEHIVASLRVAVQSPGWIDHRG